MANLDELLQQSLMSDEEKMNLALSGYYANQAGQGSTSFGNPEYSQAMQYQDMVRQANQPNSVLYFNDRPVDNPFEEYGGRISTGIPMGEQERLNLGLSANAFNNPYEKQPLRPTGIDASYQQGNTGYGVSYEQLSPDQKKLLFSIFKEF